MLTWLDAKIAACEDKFFSLFAFFPALTEINFI